MIFKLASLKYVERRINYESFCFYILGESVSVTNISLSDLDLSTLIKQYITYEGSLTQPPCNENVVWILSNKPIYVSALQMQLLRNIAEHSFGLGHNWRPVQNLYQRCIRTNIEFNEVSSIE